MTSAASSFDTQQQQPQQQWARLIVLGCPPGTSAREKFHRRYLSNKNYRVVDLPSRASLSSRHESSKAGALRPLGRFQRLPHQARSSGSRSSWQGLCHRVGTLPAQLIETRSLTRRIWEGVLARRGTLAAERSRHGCIAHCHVTISFISFISFMIFCS